MREADDVDLNIQAHSR